MIRAALKLLFYFAVVWVTAAEWEWALRVAEGLVRGMASSGRPGLTMLTLGGLLAAVQLCGTALLVAPVPLDRELGPLRHPLPHSPMRLRLRLRASRFLSLTLLWGLALVMGVRLLDELIAPAAVVMPGWAVTADTLETWLLYGVLHVIAALVVWLVNLMLAQAFAARSAVGRGFVRYHVVRAPLSGAAVRLVLFVHWPLAAFSATNLPHPWHAYLAAVSLAAIVLAVLLAEVATLLVERRRDRWLAALPDAELSRHTVQFLHPDAGPAFDPVVRHRQAPAPGREEAGEPPAAPAREPLAPVLPRVHDLPVDEPVPDTSGARLEAALDARERGEIGRARALLSRVAAEGDQAERERAEALLAALPGRWRGFKVALAATAATALAAAAVVTWHWFALPSADETVTLARAAHVHVRKGGEGEAASVDLLGTRYDYSLNTSLDNVSEHFVHAVVASEDHRFFDHGPPYLVAKFVEAGALCALRKLNVFSSASACAGNSTIPQQLARNLFLSEIRSVGRKLKELLWAIKMEVGLEKHEILELYVNRIYLGRGNFGVELASRSYFRKPASELGLLEAAYLAAAVKRPGWNWHQDREGALARANLILRLMRRHGYADASARFPARFEPVLGSRPPSKPYLGHLWQWIRPAVEEALAPLPAGDYKVLTTLDAEVEIYAERALSAEVERLRRGGTPVSQGAAVIMRPTGEVLAMVGGVGDDVRARGFNRAKRTSGLHTRPPASAFKPFIYLAALEDGMRPGTRINAGPIAIAMPPPQPPYTPRNYDGRTYGRITLRDGLVNSINTAAVNLLYEHVGFDDLFDVLSRVGIDVSDFKRQWGVALGSNGVSLVELAGAYSVFANGGRSVEPYAFSAITTAEGKIAWRRTETGGRRVFVPSDIAALNEMLEAVVSEGTAKRARSDLPRAVRVAGKTGTGDGFVDAFFVGYTPDLVMAVWMGNDRPRSMPGLFGGTGPARAFNRVLRDLVAYTDVVEPGLELP